MLRAGDTLKSAKSHSVLKVIDTIISSGTQGCAHLADMGGKKVVIKEFHTALSRTMEERLKFLADRTFYKMSPTLVTPTDLAAKNGKIIGHVTPFIENAVSFEQYLSNPSSSYTTQIEIAIAISHAVDVLHQNDIAHGDLHSENILLKKHSDHVEVFLIDFDNFISGKHSKAPCVGHMFYIAPELRIALNNSLPAIPSIRSELFALGVMLSEVLLMRHPAQGHDNTPDEFFDAMTSGYWLNDPASSSGKTTPNAGGYPALILNAEISNLFRRAFSKDLNIRPSAAEWKIALNKVLHSVYLCDTCAAPVMIDSSKRKCYACGNEYACLTMVLKSNGRRIQLAQASVILGRNDLGASMSVSNPHFEIKRIGPETWVTSLGKNGTFRMGANGWFKLPDNQPILLRKGDIIRFADCECYFE